MIFVTLLFLGLVLGLVIASWLYNHLWGPLRNVPGPTLSKVTFLHLAFYDLYYTRNDKILEWHRRYGPVVCLSPTQVSVGTLQGAKQMYGATQKWAKSDYFDHFTGYDGMRSAFATKTYNEHQAKRRLISGFYQASNIFKDPEIEKHVQERAMAVMRQVEGKQKADVYCLADWYALDNITFLILGPSHCSYAVDRAGPERDFLRDLKHQQFLMASRIAYPRTYNMISKVLKKLSPSFDYLLADETLAAWCWQKLSHAIEDPSLHSSHSLLRQLTVQQDSRKVEKRLTRTYIAAEALDNINAAEATVAVTATYLIWQLTKNPPWQHRIRSELVALAKQQDSGSIAFADLDAHVPSLDACIREVLRLHPASSGRAERIVPKGGATFSETFLPENTVVTTSVLALHHDELVFPSSTVFDPERWLDKSTFKKVDAQLASFGVGGRICLGKALALMELKILAAAIYGKYETVSTGSWEEEETMMKQCSTHDAVPRGLRCVVEFVRVH
jgi:cytochrome P450